MSKDSTCYLHPKTGNVVTCKGRILWNALFQPRKGKGGKEGKFEFNLLIPKDSDVKVLREAAVEAGKDKFSKDFREADGKWPKKLATPFKPTVDNDKLVAALEEANLKVEDFPLYFAARAKDKPGVAGPNGKTEGVTEEHVYSGRWARMTVDTYPYDVDGNRGVTLGLKNVQLLDNDDELVVGGSRVSAESEFDAVEGAGDDSKSSDNMFA